MKFSDFPQFLSGIIPQPIWGSSSPTPTRLNHRFVITCTECVFSIFFNKNKQQSHNSNDTHHSSPTINKIPEISLTKLIP